MTSAANGRDKITFAIAKDAWLRAIDRHKKLTPSAKWFGHVLSRYFNRKHFEATGELYAYPKYETLKEWIPERTLSRAIKALEKAKVLDVAHGRYNLKKGQRERNLYRAKNPSGQNGQLQVAKMAEYLFEAR